MTDFENLKSNYALAIQIGIASKMSYNEAKRGNEVLHKFCKNLVESSSYDDETKKDMKYELDVLKEALSKEIDSHYAKY